MVKREADANILLEKEPVKIKKERRRSAYNTDLNSSPDFDKIQKMFGGLVSSGVASPNVHSFKANKIEPEGRS